MYKALQRRCLLYNIQEEDISDISDIPLLYKTLWTHWLYRYIPGWVFEHINMCYIQEICGAIVNLDTIRNNAAELCDRLFGLVNLGEW